MSSHVNPADLMYLTDPEATELLSWQDTQAIGKRLRQSFPKLCARGSWSRDKVKLALKAVAAQLQLEQQQQPVPDFCRAPRRRSDRAHYELVLVRRTVSVRTYIISTLL